MDQFLEKIYYDPKHPAGFSNAEVLYRYSKDEGYKRAAIKKWLRSQWTYTLYRPARKHLLRNRIEVTLMDEQWEVDLADLIADVDENEGWRYLFCCIDVLSKYAWVIPLKRKNGPALVEGFEKLFAMTERRPEKIRADKGGEFVNKKVMAYLKERDIDFFTSQNETKACIVERFQRTLKGYMWRFFTKQGRNRWIDALPGMVHAYNNRHHRSIAMKPAEVTWENQEAVRATLFPDRTIRYKFKIGDFVRISKNKGVFEKGYKESWSEEIYTVTKRIARKQPVYTIQDSQKERIVGTFYAEELQKVEKPEVFLIDEVIQERGRGEKKEVFVSWKGYPKEANQWIPASYIEEK